MICFLKTAFSVSSSYHEKKRLHLTFNSISPRWLSLTVCLRRKGLQERVLLGQGWRANMFSPQVVERESENWRKAVVLVVLIISGCICSSACFACHSRLCGLEEWYLGRMSLWSPKSIRSPSWSEKCVSCYLGLQRLNSKIDAEIDFWVLEMRTDGGMFNLMWRDWLVLKENMGWRLISGSWMRDLEDLKYWM